MNSTYVMITMQKGADRRSKKRNRMLLQYLVNSLDEMLYCAGLIDEYQHYGKCARMTARTFWIPANSESPECEILVVTGLDIEETAQARMDNQVECRIGNLRMKTTFSVKIAKII